MYVSTNSLVRCYQARHFARLKLVVSSSCVPGLRPLYVWAYRFPCGRIKLVVISGCGLVFGTPGFSHAVFDSVSSLYNVPGLRVYTDRRSVYLALGMKPYGCK